MRILNSTTVKLLDTSELMRPEALFAAKGLQEFRDYTVDKNDPLKERVRLTYKAMHTNQTVDFVKGQIYKEYIKVVCKNPNVILLEKFWFIEKMAEWLTFNHFRSNIKDALEMLNNLVDESDPDVDIPNIVHAFQTAEKIREDHPDLDWFHLTGLIHDLGKVMAFYEEPQWAVVGDTFVVGCEWAPSIVYRDTSFVDNPDGNNSRYNTTYGMYEANCGLDKLTLSWGHDEYLYRVLKHNKTTLPEEALCMIRYHSFYPWHAGGDYGHLTTAKDEELKKCVLCFNKYDLYTKSEVMPDIKALWPYYQNLIDKYIPGVLEW